MQTYFLLSAVLALVTPNLGPAQNLMPSAISYIPYVGWSGRSVQHACSLSRAVS